MNKSISNDEKIFGRFTNELFSNGLKTYEKKGQFKDRRSNIFSSILSHILGVKKL